MIAVIRTVGRVQINRQMRIPSIKQSDERVGFRRFELDVIAVEIEALRVFARTDAADWAVLRSAVIQADLLVAVGVVYRSDQDDQIVEQWSQISGRYAPRQMQRRLLTLDFTCVNVCLNEYDRLAGGARLYAVA